jgi:hypothetical protein
MDDKNVPRLTKYVPFNRFKTRNGSWTKVDMNLYMPRQLNAPYYRIRIFISYEGKNTFYLDDVCIRFD